MAILPQRSLFCWQEIEDLRDLERLRLVLGYLPDESLMLRLEAGRGQGRDDYPVRAVWNSCLAGIVFQHPSVESLRRELSRNPSLRQACGFDPLKGMDAVPTPWAYSHFLQSRLAYKNRTAVERVNSRLDVSFGFERHFIRGQSKMRLRMGLALIVMLAMAYGRIKEKQQDKMRSLVGAA
jgi:hypothetical protein